MNPKPFNGIPLLRKAICPALLAAILAGGVRQGFAQQSDANPPVETTASNISASVTSSSKDDQYRIGPGDVLRVEVFNRTQLSREENVDMRGMIRMPLIEEDIRASCRTEKELAAEIARLYRDRQLLKNPLVSVSVKDFQSQPVAVMGAVNSPGRFVLRRRVRLLELLVFHAGGPTAQAGRKVQVLSTALAAACEGSPNFGHSGNATTTNEDVSVVTYDLRELVQGNEAMNPYVQQGDIINIPAAEQAIIVGNVLHPSAVSLAEPTTLGRAIATVGGVLPDSQKDKIRITRQITGSTASTELLVDLKATDKSKGADFLLQGGDIVEVSTKTGLSMALKKMANSMLPMLTNAPYRIIP